MCFEALDHRRSLRRLPGERERECSRVIFRRPRDRDRDLERDGEELRPLSELLLPVSASALVLAAIGLCVRSGRRAVLISIDSRLLLLALTE